MAKFKSPGLLWQQLKVAQNDFVTADIDKLADIDASAAEIDDALDGNTATAAEITRVADKSASVVNETGATLTLTAALHGSRIVTLSRAAGVTVTLPAATGSGERYTIITATTVSSNANIIQAASASDSFTGGCVGVDTDGEGATGYTWNADANDDTITMDGTATGGVAGDKWEIIDYASGLFMVFGYISQSGASEATPFSAAVS
jgi:hypothetical protein